MPSTRLPSPLGPFPFDVDPWSALAGAVLVSCVWFGARLVARRRKGSESASEHVSVAPTAMTSRRESDLSAPPPAATLADTTVDLAQVLVCRFEADTKLTWFNAAYARLWGRAPEELLGRRWIDLMPEAGRAAARERLALLTPQRPVHVETCAIVGPNGRRELEWVRRALFDANGALREIVATGSDVTESRRLIAELADQRQQLEIALDASELGLWDLDVDSGHVHRSRQWHELLGVEVGSVVSTVQGWAERVHPDDLSRVIANTDANMRGESRAFCVEYRIRHGSGRWVWVEDRGRVVEFHADGRPKRAVGVVSDATERRRIALELEDSRAEAVRESEAKGSFLANMSHEIRTPLTAVLGYAELAQDEIEDPLGDPARVAEQLDAVLRNGRHLQELLDGVLDLSKIQAGEAQLVLERTDVREVARDAIAMLAGRAKQKGLELVFETAGPLPSRVRTDALRVRQVLVNLLGNALKFTNGGRITVRLRLTQGGGRRLATSMPGELHVEVEDHGVGMDAATLQRVFQPFRQADASTSRRFGGTGLGLTISRHLARMLGGELDAVSAPGEGSTFRLVLPLDLEDLACVEHGNTPPALPARGRVSVGGGRVLLVEDGADNRRLIGIVLERAGLTVATAENGREGVDAVLAARARGEPFDVVLMDVQMPVLDGYAATRELREHGVEAPILALTANAFAEERQRCLEAGCNDHCTKPIQRELFVATIAKWLAVERARVGAQA